MCVCVCGYNLFPPTLSDPNSYYPSYSQHYPLVFAITNHNPKLGNHTQKHTHTTCNNWEQDFLNQSFTHQKEKRFTWES